MSKDITAFDWAKVREQFRLHKDYIHIGASQFYASHPKPVRDAIERYRDALDKNPVTYTIQNEKKFGRQVRESIAGYFDVDNPDNIALTDSATMGLGILYTGLNVHRDNEVLMVKYDHYSHQESIRFATKRTGALVREISFFHNPHEISQEDMVEAAVRGINDKTRVLGITWVHSSNGLKVPVARIAKAIKEVNEARNEENKVLLVVDGVHGFGIELETFPQIGCDYFITSTHKWLYGPRGTGFIAATKQAWQKVSPVIPCYSSIFTDVTTDNERPETMSGKQMTPGGFHSLEHRWAVIEAFEFIQSIGKERIYSRVHELAARSKQGLVTMPHVTLHTPMDEQLSSGIIAFEVDGYTTKELVTKLIENKVIVTASPYKESYARFSPGIINTEEEIDQALDIVSSLRKKK